MKIDNSIKTVTGDQGGPSGARAGKGATGSSSASSAAGAAGAAGSGRGDSVQLSPLSSQMQAMESSMADAPAVDGARVAEIRRAIAEGRFKVNPDVVADHLLQTARELLRSRLN